MVAQMIDKGIRSIDATDMECGIYVGDGYGIHFTRTGVDKTCLDCFGQEGEKLHSLHSYAYWRPLPEYWLTRWVTCTALPNTKSAQEVVNKARDLHEGDGFGWYNLINNNCEHFALFCQTNTRASTQTTLVSACGGVGRGGGEIKCVREWAIKLLQGIKFE